jgi:hypothetical protein
MLKQTYIALDERRLLARFWQSASGFWRGRSAWRAWLLITLLIASANRVASLLLALDQIDGAGENAGAISCGSGNARYPT